MLIACRARQAQDTRSVTLYARHAIVMAERCGKSRNSILGEATSGVILIGSEDILKTFTKSPNTVAPVINFEGEALCEAAAACSIEMLEGPKINIKYYF
ncbi:hypothetical protein [Xanthomonas oryzae]|uniref:Uncharacterized protein n=2 Tax=Xanthomonas oryzae TaxID=347 RepID=A0AAJ5MBG3_XANOO|nr:hypothetical protein [Xanthomonas oryzae]MDI9069898.1 hypothetical protein [Xanthomonas oryzae pv. oryzae]MDI9080315.1 hypothetical protein [Xanthomonas oryzae pv. oryzae]MDI9103242.1 hypothetical protein [Xanthomonas oryzae pv. oryzae]MDI9911974.1 hypothetical protein [Xanthomonas oryzae pv. oryzae]QGN64443.1 hypothetical protein GKO49_18735 [Xanthomonas oryzae pv. oryzae]